MLQFIDNIKSSKGFVDLHIHTNDSYGDEMDLMNLTPEELLESIYQYTLNNNHCPVTFAVTDHNSIEGVKKIRDIIKSDKEKYSHINFISGCEFSCSAGSLGTFTNLNGYTRNIAKNFHMLAYNFDENNEDIQFITKLYSTRRRNTIFCGNIYISAGSFIFATQNILKDHGLIVPITEFKGINLNTKDVELQDFVSEIVDYCDRFNISEEIKQDIHDQLISRNILQLGKLDCMEIMEIVENAGGSCVLAHPYIVKLSSWAKKNEVEFEKFLKVKLKENNITPTLKSYDNFLKYMIYSLKYNAKSPTTGKKLNGIVGIETLHQTNLEKKYCLPNLVSFAEEYNLYMTCGSDCHGTLIKGSILSKFLKKKSLSDFYTNNVVVTNCALANEFLNSEKIKPDCKLSFDEQFDIYKFNENETLKLNYSLLQHEAKQSYKHEIQKENTQNNAKKNKNYSKNRDKSNNKTTFNFAQNDLEEVLNIIQTGKNNIEIVNKRLKNLTENDYDPVDAMKVYKSLGVYKKAIIFAIKNVNSNKQLLKENDQAVEFINLFQENKKLTNLFRKKYESVYYNNTPKNEYERTE